MNEIEASQQWYRRGKKYHAAALGALGQLYGDKESNLTVAEFSDEVRNGKVADGKNAVKRKNGDYRHDKKNAK